MEWLNLLHQWKEQFLNIRKKVSGYNDYTKKILQIQLRNIFGVQEFTKEKS